MRPLKAILSLSLAVMAGTAAAESGKISLKASYGGSDISTEMLEDTLNPTAPTGNQFATDFDLEIGYRTDEFIFSLNGGARNQNIGDYGGSEVEGTFNRLEAQASVYMFKLGHGVTIAPMIGVATVIGKLEADGDVFANVSDGSTPSDPNQPKSHPNPDKPHKPGEPGPNPADGTINTVHADSDMEAYQFTIGAQADYDYKVLGISNRLNLDVSIGVVGEGNYSVIVLEHETFAIKTDSNELSFGLGFRSTNYSLVNEAEELVEFNGDSGAFASVKFGF